MTPAARWAAAIEILDRALGEQPVEQALTTWGRRNRFAGSKDRAAIRDHVFDIVRKERSAAWAGGAGTGRGLVLGALRLAGEDPDTVFSEARFAPPPLTEDERRVGRALTEAPRGVRLDLQDWVLASLDRALGADTDAVATALRERAPVMLRANRAKASREEVLSALTGAGYAAEADALSPTAIRLLGPVRGLQTTEGYEAGHFDLQDAASQAVVDRLSTGLEGARVLDYCAGGGGKSLALAAYGAEVTAHDAAPERMSDLPARARRAGVVVETSSAPRGAYDLVLCDAPCSGSGAWRRQPEGKWRLSEARLAELTRLQDSILDKAKDFVGAGGRLAFATCSLFLDENEARADAFVARHPEWRETDRMRLSPLDGGDGFFLSVFERV